LIKETAKEVLPIRLFDNPLSPYALKVRISLYEKGLDFEQHVIVRHGDAAELLAVNPRGEVPALVDGDDVIVDSRVICEYLDERYPEMPLLPEEPAERAKARAVELSADTKLDAAIIVLALLTTFRPNMAAQYAGVLEDVKESLAKHQAVLNRMLGNGDYFCSRFSRADISVLPHVAFAEFMGAPIADEFVALKSWYSRMGERPSVARAIGEAMSTYQSAAGVTDPFFSNDRLHWRSDRIESLLRFGLGPWLIGELEAGTGFLPPAP